MGCASCQLQGWLQLKMTLWIGRKLCMPMRCTAPCTHLHAGSLRLVYTALCMGSLCPRRAHGAAITAVMMVVQLGMGSRQLITPPSPQRPTPWLLRCLRAQRSQTRRSASENVIMVEVHFKTSN